MRISGPTPPRAALLAAEQAELPALDEHAGDAVNGGQIIRSACAAAGTDDIFHIDAFDHPQRRLFGGSVAQIIAIGHQRLVAVAAVQVDIGVHILDEHLEEHVREPVRLAALPVAGKDAVEIFAVLKHTGHGAVFKAGAVGQGQDDHAAVKLFRVQLAGQLDGRLDRKSVV